MEFYQKDLLKESLGVIYKTNRVAGNVFGDLEGFDKSVNLITEEAKELREDGGEAKNAGEVRDASADLAVVIGGLAYCVGISLDDLGDVTIDRCLTGEANYVRVFVTSGDVFTDAKALADTVDFYVGHLVNPPAELDTDLKRLGFYADIINDLLLAVFGFGYRFRLPTQTDLDAVNFANLDKFPTTMAQAEDSKAWYATQGVESTIHTATEPEGQYFVLISSKDQTSDAGKFWKQGKYMKRKGWVAPTYD